MTGVKRHFLGDAAVEKRDLPWWEGTGSWPGTRVSQGDSWAQMQAQGRELSPRAGSLIRQHPSRVVFEGGTFYLGPAQSTLQGLPVRLQGDRDKVMI